MPRSPHLIGLAICASVSAIAAACGSDGGPDVDAGPERDAGTDPLFIDPPRFDFVVTELRSSDGEGNVSSGSLVAGSAFAAERTRFHTESAREGSCRSLTYEAAFCQPFCDGVCLPGNVCDPFPTFESVGRVTLSGLRARVTITEFDGRYSADSATDNDVFDAGDAIELVAAGAGGAAGFSLSARGVAPLVTSIGDALELTDGADATVSWDPVGDGDRVRLIVRSTNAAHGLPLDHIIECEGPDSGSLAIPRALVEAFPDSSPSLICASVDCPASELSRYSLGETSYQGATAALLVTSQYTFPVSHD